jgi:hypothetical protein
MPSGNVVQFGWVTLPDIPSAEGTQIKFVVPGEVDGRGEVPPRRVHAGDYRVTVTTSAGTSNALIFTLRLGP